MAGIIAALHSHDRQDSNARMSLRRLLLLFICSVAFAGCAVSPAQLHLRPSAAGEARRETRALAAASRTEQVLAENLNAWIAAPESATGKVAGGRFVRLWRKAVLPNRCTIAGWKVHITGDWKPDYFEELLPSGDYEVRGPFRRYVRDGRGVPLVGVRQNTRREPIEALYPPEAITRPVTATLQRRTGRSVTVTLHDPSRDEDLAADFTAPFVQLLSQASALQASSFKGLLNADATRRDYALYLMEPYDPRKMPVIMVHGLLSTPLAWASLTNDLWGDAAFRRRYQVWHYLYPTSAPYLYSAKMLRQRLGDVRALLDPQGTDSASQKTVIIAHSMGGLLTRTLITDSGEDIWNTVFLVPPSALRGRQEDRAEVDRILHWKARRDVSRVIFVAVPHRGSQMASSFVGRIGDALAGLPRRFTGLYARIHRENPKAMHPAFRGPLSRGKLTSIDTLSPRHPILRIMDEKPIAPWVTVHSIIGDRGRGGPLALSSDGVVPYASSHLDAAASELVVPAGHGAYEHPRAVAEILRILNR